MIIYDLETKTFNNKVDPNADRLKVFAYKDTITGEKGCLLHTEKEKIQQILHSSDVKVGFNNWRYDDVILRREGYSINGEIRDLYFEMKRLTSKDGWYLPSYSLANICKTIGISNKQNGFDYNLLQEDEKIKANWDIIEEYALQDIQCTEELVDFIDGYSLAFNLFPCEDTSDLRKCLTHKVCVFNGNQKIIPKEVHNPLLEKFLARYNLELEEDTSKNKEKCVNSMEANKMVMSTLSDTFESDQPRAFVADDSYQAKVVEVGLPYNTKNQDNRDQEKFRMSFELIDKKSEDGKVITIPMFLTTTNSRAKGRFSQSKLNACLALLSKDEEFDKYWNSGDEKSPSKQSDEDQKKLFQAWMQETFLGKKFKLFTKTANANDPERRYSTVDRIVEVIKE